MTTEQKRRLMEGMTNANAPERVQMPREVFIEWLKGGRRKNQSEWAMMLWHVEENMRNRGDWHYEKFNTVLIDYALANGWPAVLEAMAEAMREHGL